MVQAGHLMLSLPAEPAVSDVISLICGGRGSAVVCIHTLLKFIVFIDGLKGTGNDMITLHNLMRCVWWPKL